MGLLSKAADKYGSITRSSVKKEVRSFMKSYAKTNGSFHCIIIKAGYTTVSGMVSHIGSAWDMGNGKCLVLVPRAMDRQLLAHRLSESLSAGILCQYAAASPDEALTTLASFL